MKKLILLVMFWEFSSCKTITTDVYDWNQVVYSCADSTAMYIKDYDVKLNQYTLEVDTGNNKGLQNWTFHLGSKEFFQ